MKKVILVALALALSPMLAHAQKKEATGKRKSLHQEFSGQGYGMAGCGLGSIVFGEQGGLVQVVAATLNSTGYQSVAITVGTSNCSEKGVFGQTTDYINTNKVALESDLARGEGETLASLSALMNCDNGAFGSDLKKHYTQSFPQGGATSEQISALAWKACAN